MRTVVDPVFLDIMKSATLWIVANQKREKAFLEDADIDSDDPALSGFLGYA